MLFPVPALNSIPFRVEMDTVDLQLLQKHSSLVKPRGLTLMPLPVSANLLSMSQPYSTTATATALLVPVISNLTI